MANEASKIKLSAKAASRLKHQNAIRILCTGTEVQLELTENMSVTAQAVTCVNADLTQVMVEQ